MLRPTLPAALIAAALVASACGARDTAARDTAAGDTTAGGMAAMPGMTTESGRMMDAVQAHLRALDGASADSLRAALPAHRRLVANLIAQTNREMRDMHMTADAAWDATVDSLRQDLTRMPELSPGELAATMPAHRARVDRLIASHREMLRRMGM